jgi:homoserine O-acetyltransferase
MYEHTSDLRIGMSHARMLGMLSYRSPEDWQTRFARDRIAAAPKETQESFAPEFAVEGYLRHKVNGFIGQYDANCYLYLSRAIDRFDLADAAGGDLKLALSQLVLERAVVIGTETDILYPIWQQKDIADGLARSNVPTEFLRLESLRGHDAFLADFEQFAPPVARFLETLAVERRTDPVM